MATRDALAPPDRSKTKMIAALEVIAMTMNLPPHPRTTSTAKTKLTAMIVTTPATTTLAVTPIRLAQLLWPAATPTMNDVTVRTIRQRL